MKRRVRTGLVTRGSRPPTWTRTEPHGCNPPEEYPLDRPLRGAETMWMVSQVVFSGLDIFSAPANTWASDRAVEEECAVDVSCDGISVGVPLTAHDGLPCARALTKSRCRAAIFISADCACHAPAARPYFAATAAPGAAADSAAAATVAMVAAEKPAGH